MRYQITSYELLKEMLKSIPEGDACMEWPRGRGSKGYGLVPINGRPVPTHRLAYEIAIGPIPEGLLVCHKCDNPPCFRPDHLFAGTSKDNTQDCIKKGRFNRPSGSAHHRAKLTESQVKEMRALRLSRWSLLDLSARFDISLAVISRICRGQAWPAA